MTEKGREDHTQDDFENSVEFSLLGVVVWIWETVVSFIRMIIVMISFLMMKDDNPDRKE